MDQCGYERFDTDSMHCHSEHCSRSEFAYLSKDHLAQTGQGRVLGMRLQVSCVEVLWVLHSATRN